LARTLPPALGTVLPSSQAHLVEKKNVYRLDNQEKAEKWAGQIVIVTGDLDVKKNVITIGSIQLAQSPK
jgi:predicted nuclease of predicted toxin-antitoxin system